MKKNLKFGVEIEFFGVTRQVVCDALQRVGISCEVENYNHTTHGWWKLVTDGSVNSTDCGQSSGNELVSPPLEGLAGLAELKLACTILQEVGAKVDKSCGIHVHHDAAGLGLQHFKNLYNLYRKFEHSIDYLFPKSRRENNNYYCRKVSDSELSGIERARTIQELGHVMGDRYRKLNFQSYFRHGTVEFRQHSGSTDAEKIGNWVLITHKMVEKAFCNQVIELPKAGWRECDSNWGFRQLVGKDLAGYVVNRMGYWHEKEKAGQEA